MFSLSVQLLFRGETETIDKNTFTTIHSFLAEVSRHHPCEQPGHHSGVSHLTWVLRSVSATWRTPIKLGDGFLAGYPHLQGFTMANNNIPVIGRNVFKDASQLVFLLLVGCQIESLEDPFSNLHNLKVLKLSENMLRVINKTTFIGLNKLELLGLGGNRLVDLHKDSFSGMPNLLKVGLDANFLTSVKQLFELNQQLKRIVLGTNRLTKIELPKTLQLERISLNTNLISEITPFSLLGARFATNFLLHENPISIVHPNAFNFSNVLNDFSIGCCDNKYLSFCHRSSWNVSHFERIKAKNILISGCVEEINDRAFESVQADYLAIQWNRNLKRIGKHALE